MITIKRLDYTSTVGALLCIAARHAATADGVRQQALDEIQSSLNNVAAIIARHRLADAMNAPVPPVPNLRPTDDDDEPEELAEEDAAPEEPQAAPLRERHPGGIDAAILAYLDDRGSATAADIAPCLPYAASSVRSRLSWLLKAGHIQSNNKRPPTYCLAARHPRGGKEMAMWSGES